MFSRRTFENRFLNKADFILILDVLSTAITNAKSVLNITRRDATTMLLAAGKSTTCENKTKASPSLAPNPTGGNIDNHPTVRLMPHAPAMTAILLTVKSEKDAAIRTIKTSCIKA